MVGDFIETRLITMLTLLNHLSQEIIDNIFKLSSYQHVTEENVWQIGDVLYLMEKPLHDYLRHAMTMSATGVVTPYSA
jgi:hypothetical protein